MHTLAEVMADARERGIAIGHFNISDSTQLNAIAAAARELDLPVIIGVSEGEREFVGLAKTVAMVHAAREEFGVALYTNADHTHDVDGCKRAIDAGFDSVIFDGSKLSLEENIEKTAAVVTYAKESGRDVIVEGELGYIGSSSKLLDDVPDDVVADALPSAQDAADYVEKTGVTALAPAVGNLHGMLKGRSNPALNIGLIEEMKEVAGVPLVLHGGSGVTDDDFRAAIAAGMSVVHINTQIRVAYRHGIEEGLAANTDEIAPYRYLDHGRDAVTAVVRERLKLFSNMN